MSTRPGDESEIREILIAANSGEAQDAQLERLDEIIRSDASLASYAARMLDQQAALAWHGVVRLRQSSLAREATSQVPAGGSASDTQQKKPNVQTPHSGKRGWAWLSLAAGIAFVLGAVSAPGLWQVVLQRKDEPQPLRMVGSQSAPTPAIYDARLVSSTACLWDQDSVGTRTIGSRVASGESLHLLEGLAEFNLRWSVGGSATLSLEGPAAMMLTSEGMPALRFGRLTATLHVQHHPFVLETPVGRLSLPEYGSIGVSAFGNDAEIHVFDGSATLERDWLWPTSREAAPLRIDAGQAVRIHVGEHGEPLIERHPANEAYFAAQVSMTSDILLVPPSYVNEVKAAAPIGYWRMESENWPEIPNEMGPQFDCHAKGSLGRVGRPGHQALEFGVSDEGGEILCNDVLDKVIHESYSVEAWIKLSHYHLGAVVSLVGDSETRTGVNPHGMLLEMGGSGLIPTPTHHPGRIRFLHRNPASNRARLGTSCYSETPYALRKWQHVVAVKDGVSMWLYVNGELAGQGEDDSPLPSGLRLLVGRLYPSRGVRPFIGQLDELALYDRALRPDEIAAHYRILRPKANKKPTQSANENNI